MTQVLKIGRQQDYLGVERRTSRSGYDLVSIARLRPLSNGMMVAIHTLNLSLDEARALAEGVRAAVNGEEETDAGSDGNDG